MNLEYIFDLAYDFLLTNQLIALAILIVLVLFAWKKTWQFCKFLMVILALLALVYLADLMSGGFGVGVDKKQEITTEREDILFKDSDLPKE